jgi:hypothetical protein
MNEDDLKKTVIELTQSISGCCVVNIGQNQLWKNMTRCFGEDSGGPFYRVHHEGVDAQDYSRGFLESDLIRGSSYSRGFFAITCREVPWF